MSMDALIGQIMYLWYTPDKLTYLPFTEILKITLQPIYLDYVSNVTGQDVDFLNTTITQYIQAANYIETFVSQPTEPPTQPINQSWSATGNIVLECQVSPSLGSFTNFTLIPAILIILLFMFLDVQESKRKNCYKKCYRPGICVPVNLVDSYENRLGFACAFGTTIVKILYILLIQDYNYIFDKSTQSLQKELPGWIKVLWRLLAMMIIGVSHYPYFACISTQHKLVGAIIGFFYSLMWLIFTIFWNVQCYNNLGKQYLLMEQLPVLVCLVVIIYKYLKRIINIVVKKSRLAIEKYEEMEWKSEYKYKYVMKLLQPKPKNVHPKHLTFKDKIMAKVYKWQHEFKYSTRIVCTYFVGILAVYQLVATCAIISFLLGQIVVFVETFKTELQHTAILMQLVSYKDLLRIVTTLHVAWIVVLVFTTLLILLLIANMLSWYREHLSRIRRGERNFLPVEIVSKTPSAITVAGLKYSGYQIAYIVWGFVVIQLVLYIIATVIGVQVFYPMIDGTFDSFFWRKLRDIWPTIVFSLCFLILERLLAKFVFLYDRGLTLALNNRKLFHVTAYFAFFFNVFIGIVSCAKRIIIGLVLGVLFLARTQKSVLSRDYELKDPGFDAYVAYLYLEHTHANPVLVTFCQLLIKAASGPCSSEKEPSKNSLGGTSDRDIYLSSRRRSQNRRVQNRWLLLITLLNNPSLKEVRRPEKFQHKSVFSAFNTIMTDAVGSVVDSTVPPDLGKPDNEHEKQHIDMEV